MKHIIVSLGSLRAPEGAHKLDYLMHFGGVTIPTMQNNLAQEKCIGEHRWLKVLPLPGEINLIEIHFEAEQISLR